MKFFGVYAFVVIAGLSAVSAKNSTFGTINPGDVKLRDENIFKATKPLQIVKLDYRYGYIQGNRSVITGIKVIDRNTKGKGGSASILSGGPGGRNVTLRFKSQRNYGLSFRVLIYGRNATRPGKPHHGH